MSDLQLVAKFLRSRPVRSPLLEQVDLLVSERTRASKTFAGHTFTETTTVKMSRGLRDGGLVYLVARYSGLCQAMNSSAEYTADDALLALDDYNRLAGNNIKVEEVSE